MGPNRCCRKGSAMNKVKHKLAAGQVVTMFNPDFASPRLVEYLGGFGLDVVWIDAERMSYDFERIEEMTRAARLAGIASVARPWLNDAGLITRYFDCGVDGIMVPHVEDGATARRMVEIVRYARPADHADKILIIMVETPTAIDRIDEIAAVSGVDVIKIGVNDVALALGFAGQPEHPEVTALLEKAIARVIQGGKTAGLNVLTNWEERMPWLLSRGVRWLNVRTNNIIARGAWQYTELLKRLEARES
jgi:4-hydroxy-2-oxoheptanedioate aldolase